MRLLLALSLLAALIGNGFARKVRLSTDFYKEVDNNGHVYKVYQPLDQNEELSAFPGEPSIPEIKASKVGKANDSFLNNADI